MRIAVYGATGFVGVLVVAELLQRGVEPVLVGRDRGRLRAAAAAAGAPDAEVRVAGLDDGLALRGAFDSADGVIGCASPFTLYGEAVVRAAITAGVPLVDVAGEEEYVLAVLDRCGQDAASAGIAVVPAANNDCLTGDLLGHLVADGLGELETISVAFTATDTEGSRGTVLMALTTQETMRTGGPVYDRGSYVRGAPARRTEVRWPGAAAASPVVRFALPPAVTIPRHVTTRHAEGLASPEIHAFFAGASPDLVASMPLRGGPDPHSRARSRYTLVVDALGIDGRSRRATLEGGDVYGTTTVIAVEAVRRLVDRPGPVGALTPAQAFDAADFLDALAPAGLTWHVEDPVTP